jgi:FdhD protein
VAGVSRGRTQHQLVHKLADGVLRRSPDDLIVEEPLEIRLNGELVTTTMRTPGHDFELAAGFCFTDGRLGDATIRTVRYCGTGSAVDTQFNVATVETAQPTPVRAARATTATSACGICGADNIDDLRERIRPLAQPRRFDVNWLASLPAILAASQPLFDTTGAVHGAAVINADGTVVCVREDVGRHNAVDKVIGRVLLDDQLPATNAVLVVSSRAGFEIVQKAWAAGFPAVVTVSAPTSLAVEAARAADMMLMGFTRDGRANIYTGVSDGY